MEGAIMLTEKDVLRMLLARRENYAVSFLSHQKGRVYRVTMNGKHYNAVVLVSSWDFYEKRYHIAAIVPTLVICYEHNTVLPVPTLSMRAGNLAEPYDLPETIYDVEAQRTTRVGSRVLLGQYMSGLREANNLILHRLPPTTRKRYLLRAEQLAKRKRGKPVGRNPSSTTA
jgi:hypothetical protein